MTWSNDIGSICHLMEHSDSCNVVIMRTHAFKKMAEQFIARFFVAIKSLSYGTI